MRIAKVENGTVTNVIEAHVMPEWAVEQDGWHLCTDMVGAGHRLVSGEWMPPLVTAAQVDAERDRRIFEGTTVTLSGYSTTIRVIGSDDSALMGVSLTAATDVLAGNGSNPVTWRDADNVDHPLTAALISDLWSAWQTFKSAVTSAGWTLKDTDPIPQNYTDAVHWP
ncbi:MAG: hypothetical protein AAFR68_04125 [Pseudomonadota bacterium]